MHQFQDFPIYTPQQKKQFDKDCALWDVVRITDFYVDPDTGQVGADCLGTTPGAVRYFRAC
jgi:hypothetical protein